MTKRGPRNQSQKNSYFNWRPWKWKPSSEAKSKLQMTHAQITKPNQDEISFQSQIRTVKAVFKDQTQKSRTKNQLQTESNEKKPRIFVVGDESKKASKV